MGGRGLLYRPLNLGNVEDFDNLVVCFFIDPTHTTTQQYNERTVVNWSEYEKPRR